MPVKILITRIIVRLVNSRNNCTNRKKDITILLVMAVVTELPIIVVIIVVMVLIVIIAITGGQGVAS